MSCNKIQKNEGDNLPERKAKIHISGNSIIVGNRGGHVSASTHCPPLHSKSDENAVNEVTESELIRIYRKLDMRHKIDFITHAVMYEEQYDAGCVKVELTHNRYTKHTGNGD